LVLDFPYIGEQQRGDIRASKVFTVSAFRDKKKTYKKLHRVRVLAKINHALCSKNEIDHACAGESARGIEGCEMGQERKYTRKGCP
jgi:hypothetical protein